MISKGISGAPAQAMRNFTVGSEMVEQQHIALRRIPVNHWTQMRDDDNLVRTRIFPFSPSQPRATTFGTKWTTKDQNQSGRISPKSPVSKNDDIFVPPVGGFPRLPNPETFGVLRFIDDETCQRMRKAKPELSVSLPTEPRVPMIWDVEQLRRKQCEMDGVPYEPPWKTDVSDIPAFQPQNKIHLAGSRLPPKKRNRVPTLPCRQKRLKTRKELDQLIANLQIQDMSQSSDTEDDGAGPVARDQRKKPRRL